MISGGWKYYVLRGLLHVAVKVVIWANFPGTQEADFNTGSRIDRRIPGYPLRTLIWSPVFEFLTQVGKFGAKRLKFAVNANFCICHSSMQAMHDAPGSFDCDTAVILVDASDVIHSNHTALVSLYTIYWSNASENANTKQRRLGWKRVANV